MRTGTPPLVRGSRRWLPWAVVVSVLLAAVGGAAVGWARLHVGAKGSSGTQPLAEAADPRPLPSEAEREKFLQTAVQQYLKPSGATKEEMAPQVRMGLDHAVELALFYLDRGRLGEADDLFGKLIAAGDKVPQYLKLGRVGHAIVLGLQDGAGESNQLFLKAVGEQPAKREQFLRTDWLKQNPKLRVWIARALEHNTQNAPNEFPRELKPLRDPPRHGP
jgi:hypothetical protein